MIDEEIINSCTRPPILLNCWKHHKRFIQMQINELVTYREEIITLLPKFLIKIGSSQIDLYTGAISPSEIANFIIFGLKQLGIEGRQEYIKWLAQNNEGYKIIELVDSSRWTLLCGCDKNRYIHIHPCRYSSHSLRIRALTLKTAISTLIWAQINQLSPFNISVVNYVRQKILEVPPLKSMLSSGSLFSLIKLLEK